MTRLWLLSLGLLGITAPASAQTDAPVFPVASYSQG